MQNSLFDLAPTLTVTELVHQIKDVVERDATLRDVWVRGEISNFTQSAAGHLYFTLKDREAGIKCVMWRTDAARVLHAPTSGDAVEARGHISLYETRGDLQLYVNEIKFTGTGALWQEFERLRRQLDAEGLFAPEHKRPLPKFPRTIGVVTSRDGAVLRDIRNVLRRRYPLVELLLAPTLVQGERAPEQIIRAIQTINRYPIDLLIVARGGGSIEDLWAFNDERVAHAIYHSRVPVISAIGHETDFTIADFVADLRAPTPSAAAELAVPQAQDLRDALDAATQRLGNRMRDQLDDARARLEQLVYALTRNSPHARLATDRQRVDDRARQLNVRLKQLVALRRAQLYGATRQLTALNPEATLARGYAIVRAKKTGRVITHTNQVAPHSAIQVRVSDGEFDATTDE